MPGTAPSPVPISPRLLEYCSQHEADQAEAKREMARHHKHVHQLYKTGYRKEADRAEAKRQQDLQRMKKTRQAELAANEQARQAKIAATKTNIAAKKNQHANWAADQKQKQKRQVEKAQQSRAYAKRAWQVEKERQLASAADKVRSLRRKAKESRMSHDQRLEQERLERAKKRRAAMRLVNAELDRELSAIETAHLREARDRKHELQVAREQFLHDLEHSAAVQHQKVTTMTRQERDELEEANEIRRQQWADRQAEMQREQEAQQQAKRAQEDKARAYAKAEYARRVEAINRQAEKMRIEVEGSRKRETLMSKVIAADQHKAARRAIHEESKKILPSLKQSADALKRDFERERAETARKRHEKFARLENESTAIANRKFKANLDDEARTQTYSGPGWSK